MPKHTTKKQQKPITQLQESVHFKEQGNAHLKKEDYEAAISQYTKAIALQPENSIYYNNRSLAHYLNYNFQASLEDAEQSIKYDPTYFKGYIRKSQALQQLNQLNQALTTLKSFENTLNQKEINEQIDTIEQELQNFTLDQPENIKNLQNWLQSEQQQNQSDLSKLHIQIFDPKTEDRGVKLTQNVKKDQQILYIPSDFIITETIALENSETNQQIQKSDKKLISDTHNTLAIFLLEQKSLQEKSKYHQYIKSLPENYNTNPIYYKENDMKLLQGTQFFNILTVKLQDLKSDYETIKQISSEFAKKYSFEDYCWARLSVSSRQFGFEINQQKVAALVPFADMMNHSADPIKMTDWNYSDENNGFTVKALRSINRGEQIFYSYGLKSNSRLLINYGFVLPNNDLNEIQFMVQFNENDTLLQDKLKLINQESKLKVCKIMQDFTQPCVKEFLGTIRFLLLDDKDILEKIDELHQGKVKENPQLSSAYDPSNTPPISLQNEKQMWQKINELCFSLYTQYPTQLEEDYQIIQDKNNDIPVNKKNCAILAAGEKEIILSMLQSSQQMLQLLEKSKDEIYKLMLEDEYKPFSKYIAQICVTIVQFQEDNNKQQQK